jgi:hypothetical protein
VHLGVMVGLAIVAPNFQPDHQQKQVFRTMCKLSSISILRSG